MPPPYPIEDKVMPKGTRLDSVSSKHFNSKNYLNSGNALYAYNPNDPHDKKVYEGPFSKYLVLYRGAQFIARHSFETVQDLTMPTKKERMDEFKSLINDKKTRVDAIMEMRHIQKRLVDGHVGSEKEQEEFKNIDLTNLKTDNDYRIAYAIFNHAMEASYAYKSTREYMKRMQDKYDAMVDDNNQGVYNDAHDPVIIFRANKVLQEVKDKPVSFLTAKEIISNTEELREELKKKGINIKL